ncbi:MAG: hypothetical protein AAF485_17775 [Chloroflexota bacterium]
MDLEQIGPFAQFFDEKGLYLNLLNLWGPEEAVTTIRRAIEESSNLEKEIQILLEDINWRPHLVAGVALLIIKSTDLSHLIWKTFDKGSWVNPQLAVVTYFHDPGFSKQAKERLDKRCPIVFELSESMNRLEFHSATGGSGNDQVSYKSMASLMALCQTIPSLAPYISELSELDDVKKMLDDDWDQAGAITKEWLWGITTCFNQLEIDLVRSENQQHFTQSFVNDLLGIDIE